MHEIEFLFKALPAIGGLLPIITNLLLGDKDNSRWKWIVLCICYFCVGAGITYFVSTKESSYSVMIAAGILTTIAGLITSQRLPLLSYSAVVGVLYIVMIFTGNLKIALNADGATFILNGWNISSFVLIYLITPMCMHFFGRSACKEDDDFETYQRKAVLAISLCQMAITAIFLSDIEPLQSWIPVATWCFIAIGTLSAGGWHLLLTSFKSFDQPKKLMEDVLVNSNVALSNWIMTLYYQSVRLQQGDRKVLYALLSVILMMFSIIMYLPSLPWTVVIVLGLWPMVLWGISKIPMDWLQRHLKAIWLQVMTVVIAYSLTVLPITLIIQYYTGVALTWVELLILPTLGWLTVANTNLPGRTITAHETIFKPDWSTTGIILTVVMGILHFPYLMELRSIANSSWGLGGLENAGLFMVILFFFTLAYAISLYMLKMSIFIATYDDKFVRVYKDKTGYYILNNEGVKVYNKYKNHCYPHPERGLVGIFGDVVLIIEPIMKITGRIAIIEKGELPDYIVIRGEDGKWSHVLLLDEGEDGRVTAQGNKIGSYRHEIIWCGGDKVSKNPMRVEPGEGEVGWGFQIGEYGEGRMPADWSKKPNTLPTYWGKDGLHIKMKHLSILDQKPYLWYMGIPYSFDKTHVKMYNLGIPIFFLQPKNPSLYFTNDTIDSSNFEKHSKALAEHMDSELRLAISKDWDLVMFDQQGQPCEVKQIKGEELFDAYLKQIQQQFIQNQNVLLSTSNDRAKVQLIEKQVKLQAIVDKIAHIRGEYLGQTLFVTVSDQFQVYKQVEGSIALLVACPIGFRDLNSNK